MSRSGSPHPLALSMLLLGLALTSLSYVPFIPLLVVQAITSNITLEGWTLGWNQTSNRNPTIRAVQGDIIILSLPNRDGAPHQFFIDLDSNSAFPPNCPPDKCSNMLPTTYQFTVDFTPGTYKYYCTFHSGQMLGDFVVQGFTLASSPVSMRVIQGSSNTSTVTVTSVNNFAGTVNLAATISPIGPTVSLSPTSVTLSSNGTDSSTLTVSTTGSTSMGDYVVNVTATSGSSSNTRNVATAVVAPDFNISASPTTIAVPLGSSQVSTITLRSLDTFSGTVDLSTSMPPTGITATLTPSSVTLSSGGTATSTLDVSVSPSATPGTYGINVTGVSGSIIHMTTVTVVAGPDFGISLNPNSLTITSGSSGASSITLTSFNNFAGTVDLTSVPSGGLTTSLNPTSAALSGGGTATSTLTVNVPLTTLIGTHTVMVSGTSGTTTHSRAITVSVAGFSLAVSNTSLTLSPVSSRTTTVTLTSLNGFSGNVDLTTTASSNTLTHFLDVSTVALSPTGPSTATLTVASPSAPAGTYTVTVTGTSGSLSHSVSLSIIVQSSSDGNDSLVPILIGAVAVAIVVAGSLFYLTRRGRSKK